MSSGNENNYPIPPVPPDDQVFGSKLILKLRNRVWPEATYNQIWRSSSRADGTWGGWVHSRNNQRHIGPTQLSPDGRHIIQASGSHILVAYPVKQIEQSLRASNELVHIELHKGRIRNAVLCDHIPSDGKIWQKPQSSNDRWREFPNTYNDQTHRGPTRLSPDGRHIIQTSERGALVAYPVEQIADSSLHNSDDPVSISSWNAHVRGAAPLSALGILVPNKIMYQMRTDDKWRLNSSNGVIHVKGPLELNNEQTHFIQTNDNGWRFALPAEQVRRLAAERDIDLMTYQGPIRSTVNCGRLTEIVSEETIAPQTQRQDDFLSQLDGKDKTWLAAHPIFKTHLMGIAPEYRKNVFRQLRKGEEVRAREGARSTPDITGDGREGGRS